MIAIILNLSAYALTLYLAISRPNLQPLIIWLVTMVAGINMVPFFVLPEGDPRLAETALNSMFHIVFAVVGRIINAWRRRKAPKP